MRIRDLRWTHRTVRGEKCEWWESDLFDYSVQPMRGGFTAWKESIQLKDFPTKEEAMAYCQHEFEKEVRKCITSA